MKIENCILCLSSTLWSLYPPPLILLPSSPSLSPCLLPLTIPPPSLFSIIFAKRNNRMVFCMESDCPPQVDIDDDDDDDIITIWVWTAWALVLLVMGLCSSPVLILETLLFYMFWGFGVSLCHITQWGKWSYYCCEQKECDTERYLQVNKKQRKSVQSELARQLCMEMERSVGRGTARYKGPPRKKPRDVELHRRPLGRDVTPPPARLRYRAERDQM